MAIGLACGSMNFILATGGTLLVLIVLTVFRKFEMKMTKNTPLLIVKAKLDVPFIAKLLAEAKRFDCVVHQLHVEMLEDRIEATFQAVSNTNELDTAGFIAAVESIEGVTGVSVTNGH